MSRDIIKGLIIKGRDEILRLMCTDRADFPEFADKWDVANSLADWHAGLYDAFMLE